MPFSRREPSVYEATAEIFRSLGHPARIRIMELLVESDRSVSDLLVQMELEPSSLSQHLAVLKRVGLVESHRSGNAVTYRLTDPSVGGIFAAAKTVLMANLGRTRQVLEDLEGD